MREPERSKYVWRAVDKKYVAMWPIFKTIPYIYQSKANLDKEDSLVETFIF